MIFMLIIWEYQNPKAKLTFWGWFSVDRQIWLLCVRANYMGEEFMLNVGWLGVHMKTLTIVAC